MVLKTWSARLSLAFLILVMVGCGERDDNGFVATVPGKPRPVETGSVAYLAMLGSSRDLSQDGLLPSGVTALRFRGLDNGGVPVYGPVTLRKSSRLTLENVPTTVVKLLVEQLEGEQTMAAALVPISLAANQVTSVKNPYFFARTPSGKAQPVAAGGAHGYFYHLASLARSTVQGGCDIPFSSNGPTNGVSHSGGAKEITIASAGDYLVDYQASVSSSIGTSLAIAVNGTVDPSTLALRRDSLGVVSGKAILRLAAGDVVTLRNTSSSALTLSLSPQVGVRVSLVQLGP